MPLSDDHTHIMLSSLDAMVAAAEATNLTACSITEHVSQFRELRESVNFGSVHSTGRIFTSLREYLTEFERLEEKDHKIRVSRGLEVDYSPRYEGKVGDFVNQECWDILLCSVHELADSKDIEQKASQGDSPASSGERWREYIMLEKMALESDFVPYQVLAHPVRLSTGTVPVPSDFDELMLDLARMAKERSRALELNGNDIAHSSNLVRRLAIACSRVGCQVSLGSDAHHPRDVSRNLDFAKNLVNELKLSEARQSAVR